MAAGDGDPGRDLGRGEDRADVAADGLGGHGRGQGGLHQVTDVGQVRYDRVVTRPPTVRATIASPNSSPGKSAGPVRGSMQAMMNRPVNGRNGRRGVLRQAIVLAARPGSASTAGTGRRADGILPVHDGPVGVAIRTAARAAALASGNTCRHRRPWAQRTDRNGRR